MLCVPICPRACSTQPSFQGLLVDHSHLDEPSAAQAKRSLGEAQPQKHRDSARGGSLGRSATCACLCSSPTARAASDAVNVSGTAACCAGAARSGSHHPYQDVHQDDHQDLHLSVDGHSKHHMALKQAELAMMENEAAVSCDELQSALGRQINTRCSQAGREMQPASLKPSSHQTNREKSVAVGDPTGSLAERLSSRRLLGAAVVSRTPCGGADKRPLKAIAHAAAGGSRVRGCAGRVEGLFAHSNGSEEGTRLLAPNVNCSDADTGWVPTVAHVGISACLEASAKEQSAIAASDAAWEARVEAREERLRNTAADDVACSLTSLAGTRSETVDRLCSPKSSPGREVSLRAAMRTLAPEAVVDKAGGNATTAFDEGLVTVHRGDAQRRQQPTQPPALTLANQSQRTVGAVSASACARSAEALPPRPCQRCPAGRSPISSTGRQRTKVSAHTPWHANDSHSVEGGSSQGRCNRGTGQLSTLLPPMSRAGQRGSPAANNAQTPVAPLTPEVQEGSLGQQSAHLKKWRIASTTVATFARRAAAGMSAEDEPLDEEEEAAIAELTRHEPEQVS